jgi:hypothetical protein
MDVHISKGWKDKSQRVAGGNAYVRYGCANPVGYMPNYLGIESVRDLTSLIDWIIDVALSAFFVWHYLGRVAAKAKTRHKSINPRITATVSFQALGLKHLLCKRGNRTPAFCDHS